MKGRARVAALMILHQTGGEVYVNPHEIMLIQRGDTFFCARPYRSAVTVHDRTICVLESPAEVKRLHDEAVPKQDN